MDEAKLDDLLRALEPFAGMPRDEARDEVLRLAEGVAALFDDKKRTPRPASVLAEWERVAEAADELRDALEQLSHYSRELMDVRFHYGEADRLRRALAEGMQPKAAVRLRAWWIVRLRSLSGLAGELPKALNLPDDPGGANPLTEDRWPPKTWLANEAWCLFGRCTDSSTAERSGPLHLFAENLLAFGVNGTPHANQVRGGRSMYDHLRAVERWLNDLHALREERERHFDAAHNARRLQLGGAEVFEKRAIELLEEWRVLSNRGPRIR